VTKPFIPRPAARHGVIRKIIYPIQRTVTLFKKYVQKIPVAQIRVAAHTLGILVFCLKAGYKKLFQIPVIQSHTLSCSFFIIICEEADVILTKTFHI
jgi:hypothetical protein